MAEKEEMRSEEQVRTILKRRTNATGEQVVTGGPEQSGKGCVSTGTRQELPLTEMNSASSPTRAEEK